MLFLVSTPIGNLSDITLRALEILKSSDYVLCEDTRHARILLQHYTITTPLRSYHQFSEAAQEEGVIVDLKEGKQIALISDAGTPAISDPGERIVQRCRKEGIPVTPIPGACALIAALTASGLSTTPFQFIGFLPRKTGALKKALIDFLHYRGSTICYESPQRVFDLLALLREIAPQHPIVIARELTKKFEEFLCGTAEELYEGVKQQPIRGEVVVLISGNTQADEDAWRTLSPQHHVTYLQETFELSEREAIKLAAELRGVPKREIYREFILEDEE